MVAFRTRSKDGCFTCRRRRKKCDESAYPKCQNCTTNNLLCTWPDHVVARHEHQEKVVLTNGPGEQTGQNFVKLHRELTPTPAGVVKPHKRDKKSILERISMQQDCVDDDVFTSEEPESDHSVLLTSQYVDPASLLSQPKILIRDYIAQQMDISNELFAFGGQEDNSSYHNEE